MQRRIREESFLESRCRIQPKNIKLGIQILKKQSKQVMNPFYLFSLEQSYLNSNLIFKELVNQLRFFNKELQTKEYKIKNSLTTYHLYRNLYHQLKDLISLCASSSQAQLNVNEIKLWFSKQKIKIREIKQSKRVFPEINHLIQDTEEDLRKTVASIRSKRQYQIFNIMHKSAYSSHFTNKDNILQYKKEQEQQTKSENNSIFSQHSVDPKNYNILHPQTPHYKRFNSQSMLASTNYTTNKNLKTSKRQNLNLKEVKLTPFSFNQTSQSKLKNLNKTLSSKSIFQEKNNKKRLFSQQNINRYKSLSLMDSLIRKDKITQICDQPDKMIKFLSKQQQKKQFQVNSTNLSRISFRLNPQKGSFLNRKQFLDTKTELNKFKRSEAQFKTELNRKIQFRRYLSNHIKSSSIQLKKDAKCESLTSRIGKNLISLSRKQFSVNLIMKKNKFQQQTNKDVNNNLQTQILDFSDPIELKKRQFEQSIKKQNINKNISVYEKYFKNHIKNDSEGKQCQSNDESQFQRTHSSRFSKSSSMLNTNKNIFKKKVNGSMTSFKFDSLQKDKLIKRDLQLTRTLQKHSVQNFISQMVDQTINIKNRLIGNNGYSNSTQNITNDKILKGLMIPQISQQLKFSPIELKLLKNPFFSIKKITKKKKSKK